MKKKEIKTKTISILDEQYINKGYYDDKTIDVPFVPDTNFVTHKSLGEEYVVDEPEDNDYEEGSLDGEVEDKKEPPYEEGELDGEVDDEDEPENYEEISDDDDDYDFDLDDDDEDLDESLIIEKKGDDIDIDLPEPEDVPADTGGEAPAAGAPAAGGQEMDPAMAGMTDPSMGANIPGMDAMGGMGMSAPKTPEQLGRIFELKKIYSRLLSIEQYLSFSSDEFLLKLKVYISKAIELFETLVFNIDSFKDKLDDVIVLYYTFVQTVYLLLKKYYAKKDKSDSEDK